MIPSTSYACGLNGCCPGAELFVEIQKKSPYARTLLHERVTAVARWVARNIKIAEQGWTTDTQSDRWNNGKLEDVNFFNVQAVAASLDEETRK